MRYAFRFFVVVPPVPSLMVGTVVLIAAVAAVGVLVDANRGAAAMTPIIVLQVFASASGFAVPARRGHYDLLFTSGQGRLRVSLAHWLATVAPGFGGWVLIGLSEMVASGGTRHAVFGTGTAAAFLLVSTLPWAIAVRLPRFAPSIGWVVLLVMVPTVVPVETVDAALRNIERGTPDYLSAAAFLLYPVCVIGQHLRPDDGLIVAPGLGVAATAMVAAVRWVLRTDIPLETGQ